MINKHNKFQNKGFTLVELLVVTAVIGVLGILSATLISSILRSQNKTAIINEVRQNGDLVISKFERDLKQSEKVCPVDTSTSPPNLDCGNVNPSAIVALTTYSGSQIVWDCTDLRRGEGDGVTEANTNATPVINTDPDNGVQVVAGSCNFTVSTGGASVPQIVTLSFTLEQRSTVQRSEYQVKEPFQVTAGTRAY